ncbi:hypothetical protein NM208_g16745 [Fusarium decemcellulare]|uniref:Uncharacterized protein n=1 Tax=Fusarium decemcellulare TaxID=57161 RepID=A0ACC1R999_9HYPO|nr:hypothetical protein NM208_g16745 [Fusarium decemcellulare]
MTGITDQLGVLGQDTPPDSRLGGFPLASPPLHLLVGDVDINTVPDGVDRHHISVLDQCNGASDHGLWHNVANNEAVGRSAVSSVRHQCQIRQASSHDGSRGLQLLGHARASLGALVPHDDNQIAVLALDLALF